MQNYFVTHVNKHTTWYRDIKLFARFCNYPRMANFGFPLFFVLWTQQFFHNINAVCSNNLKSMDESYGSRSFHVYGKKLIHVYKIGHHQGLCSSAFQLLPYIWVYTARNLITERFDVVCCILSWLTFHRPWSVRGRLHTKALFNNVNPSENFTEILI